MRIISLCFLLILPFCSFSQKNLDVLWGPWGLDAKPSQSYFSLGKSFEDTTGYLLVTKEGLLEYFDESLHKRYDAELFGGSKNVEVVLAKRIGKKAFIVVVENESACKVYKYDYRTKSVSFESQLFEMKKAELLPPSMASDTSFYVFSAYVGGKEPSVSFFVTDSLFRLKWERGALPVQTEDKNFIVPSVNSAGEVAFADTDKESLLVRVLYNKGKMHKPSAFSLLSEKQVNVMSASKGTSFSFAMLYNKENINYNCAEKLQVVQVVDAGTTPRSAVVELPDCIDNQMIVHVYAGAGMSLRVVLETFANKRNDSNNRCTYGSLHVLGIDIGQGKLLWSKEIFKNMYFVADPKVLASPQTDEYQSDFGHGFFADRNNLYFMYNDNCQNCINTVTNPKSHSNMKNSCLAVVSIDEKGMVMRHTYPSMPNVKYQVDAASFQLVSPGTVIFKSAAKQQRLGIVKLNRHYK